MARVLLLIALVVLAFAPIDALSVTKAKRVAMSTEEKAMAEAVLMATIEAFANQHLSSFMVEVFKRNIAAENGELTLDFNPNTYALSDQFPGCAAALLEGESETKDWPTLSGIMNKVKSTVKGAVDWTKDKISAAWKKFKCPLCKAAVKKLNDVVLKKGAAVACKYIDKGVCMVAAAAICEEAAPVCKAVACPAVEQLLAKACEPMVKWALEAIEKKINITPEAICKKVTMC